VCWLLQPGKALPLRASGELLPGKSDAKHNTGNFLLQCAVLKALGSNQGDAAKSSPCMVEEMQC